MHKYRIPLKTELTVAKGNAYECLLCGHRCVTQLTSLNSPQNLTDVSHMQNLRQERLRMESFHREV